MTQLVTQEMISELFIGDLEALIEKRIDDEVVSLNSDKPVEEKRNMITNHRYQRIGEMSVSNQGQIMIIDEYVSSLEVYVRFRETDSIVKTTYYRFQNGQVKDLMFPSLFGKAFIGIGKYKSIENGKVTPAYRTFAHIMERCYSKKYHTLKPTYIGCSVAEEWLNFQNFAKWYEDNYYNVGNEMMTLDKDILVKGNKVYSPETCVFTPASINCLLLKREAKRGKYPIGVTFNKAYGKLQVTCSGVDKKNKNLGYFDDSKEAFDTYREYKLSVIRETADKYKNDIPAKLYDALVNYQIDIND